MDSLLGVTSLVSKTGTTDVASATTAPLLGLYFSASWCPPCRKFTPVLASTYKDEWNKDSKKIEIVFVTFDRKEDAFIEYYGHQPWLAIPYKEEAARKSLATKYSVQGIPALIILDKTGALITSEGVETLYESGPEVIETWIASAKK